MLLRWLAIVLTLETLVLASGAWTYVARAFDENVKPTSGDWYWRGTRSLEQRNYRRAIGDLTKSLGYIDTTKFGAFNVAAKHAAASKSSEEIDHVADQVYIVALCHNARGTAYGFIGEYENAVKDFDEALKAYPFFPKAFSNRGNAYMNMGRLDRAMSDLNTATRLAPKLPEPYKNRANIYRAKKQDSLAQKELAIADKLNPAEQDFDIAFHVFVGRLVKQALTVAPKNPYLINARGASKDQLEDQRSAIKDFQLARSLDPKLTIAYQNEARALFKLGDKEAAFKVLRQTGTAFPKDAFLQDWIAWKFIEHHNYKDAIEYSNAAIKLNPKFPCALTNRAVAYYGMRDHSKEAIEDCDRAMAINARYANAYATKSAALLDFKKYKESADVASKAILFSYRSPNAYRNRGIAHMRLEMWDKADEDIDRAIQLTPMDLQTQKFINAAPHGYMELMLADRVGGTSSQDAGRSVKREDMEQEASSFSSVITVTPTFPDAYYRRALLDFSSTRPRQAVKDLERYLYLSNWSGKNSGYAASLLVLVLRSMLDDKYAERRLQGAKTQFDEKETVPILSYLLGKLDEKSLLKLDLSRAEKSRNQLLLAISIFQQGDKKRAHELLENLKATGDPKIEENILLPVFLKKSSGG